MITTRERIRISELMGGFRRGRDGRDADLSGLFESVLPLDVRYCTFMNQGKAAFEQIVLAAGLQRSRILFPAFFPDDFVGVLRKYEITPVFVDVDPDTYQIDIRCIASRHLDGARGLIVLHTFGLPADGPTFRAFCDEHGLVMIEDCARALGASRGGALVGSFGHYALFSLPKCTPVRQGGIALSEQPLHPILREAKVGVFGLLHALTLVKYPLSSLVEARLYRVLADTPLYPREVGNYDPLPAREFDRVGMAVLRSFMPHYRDALVRKRECALRIRGALESDGFKFQTDSGEHIYTALSVEPPPGCDRDELRTFLGRHGVKTSSMWRGALGVSEFAQRVWNAEPQQTPVAIHLSKRLIQLPVSRFQTPSQSEEIVSLCRHFSAGCSSQAVRVSDSGRAVATSHESPTHTA
jgi:dTDP-4-amino-4,6-dideoxygalactose transaminase